MFCPKCKCETITVVREVFIESGEYDEASGRFEYEADESLYICQSCKTEFVVLGT